MAGRVGQARGCFEAMLAAEPEDADALHLLGLCHLLEGDSATALPLIERALPLLPEDAEAHLNHALALRALGDIRGAVAASRLAVKIDPAHGMAWNNLARLLNESGAAAEAAHAAGTAVQLLPGFVGAHANLAGALIANGQYQAAEAALRAAIRLAPTQAELHSDLAVCLLHQRQIDAAVAAAQQAVALKPDFAEAHGNLGHVLQAAGRAEAALQALETAARLAPEHAGMWFNLGQILVELGRPEAAVAPLQRARALAPQDPKTAFALGQLYLMGNNPQLAAPLLTEAAGHVPSAAMLAFTQRRRLCDWAEHDRLERMAIADTGSTLLALIDTSADMATLSARARAHAARLSQPLARRLPAQARSADGNRPLRIGYLSGNYRQHPGALLLVGVIEQHDRARFEVVGYDASPDDGSEIRRRILAGFDRVVKLQGLGSEAAAARIHADAPDIAIEVDGHAQGNQLAVLGFRPAPLQVGWLGFPGPLGTDFLDYVLVDAHVAPQGDEAFHSEKLVRLAHCYQPNDDRRGAVQAVPSRRVCGLPEGAFVFSCFNALNKISPTMFDIWMRVLRAVPGSVLWLMGESHLAVENLRREAMRRGVAPDRLYFAPRVPHASHMARIGCADLFLDTLPYNAHTTGSDALWAGLLVLTCTGDSFAGRVGTSLLRAVGLSELITRDLAEYEALAVALARDPERLAGLRAQLAANLTTAPLFDTARFARDLEAAYVRMTAGK